jgi:signal transduction histidine kinase
MKKSLYSKLVLIMLTIIVSLMTVVGGFLMRGVRSFYQQQFYEQMKTVFSSAELASDLRDAADGSDAANVMAERLRAYAGSLGIDSGTRNFYILTGDTGAYITGSSTPENGIAVTANITTAISGKEGYLSDANAAYMDVALPISGDSGSYIVYIIDNKANVQELGQDLFKIIIEAMAVGLVLSVGLSMLLAKTMVTPITELTRAAEAVASGDFNHKVENQSQDEIGVLTRTFNNMAGQLEDTLDDLKTSEQTRREFVANVSHELRTPITSIRSYAETLKDDPDMPADTRGRFLGVIVNESDRMTNIVQDLLTLSKFDAGSFDFVFEMFSFEKSVRDVYNATRIEAQHHRHEFTLEFLTPVPEIRGDRARVEQVLINMVSNAIKYTRDGGVIRMTAGEKDGHVWCTVKDNGIGIPKEDVAKIFDRFYRVDKARSRESGGTGLGLSIAKEIAARHGGDITVQSVLGRGTTITVTLPVGGPEDA